MWAATAVRVWWHENCLIFFGAQGREFDPWGASVYFFFYFFFVKYLIRSHYFEHNLWWKHKIKTIYSVILWNYIIPYNSSPKGVFTNVVPNGLTCVYRSWTISTYFVQNTPISLILTRKSKNHISICKIQPMLSARSRKMTEFWQRHQGLAGEFPNTKRNSKWNLRSQLSIFMSFMPYYRGDFFTFCNKKVKKPLFLTIN
jgi:hypothetical protein